ncbi:hypothetical protein FSP39_000571 [Pinctada imbricata]|uniref:Uncharacterized protein n=1 Tax=Pinctada imbricata TaxID=66713 RepID=A0AA88XP18_PINIB|nr:hypothetical protein FSP39_000571 [Pinctada imbricata]
MMLFNLKTFTFDVGGISCDFPDVGQTIVISHLSWYHNEGFKGNLQHCQMIESYDTSVFPFPSIAVFDSFSVTTYCCLDDKKSFGKSYVSDVWVSCNPKMDESLSCDDNTSYTQSCVFKDGDHFYTSALYTYLKLQVTNTRRNISKTFESGALSQVALVQPAMVINVTARNITSRTALIKWSIPIEVDTVIVRINVSSKRNETLLSMNQTRGSPSATGMADDRPKAAPIALWCRWFIYDRKSSSETNSTELPTDYVRSTLHSATSLHDNCYISRDKISTVLHYQTDDIITTGSNEVNNKKFIEKSDAELPRTTLHTAPLLNNDGYVLQDELGNLSNYVCNSSKENVKRGDTDDIITERNEDVEKKLSEANSEDLQAATRTAVQMTSLLNDNGYLPQDKICRVSQNVCHVSNEDLNEGHVDITPTDSIEEYHPPFWIVGHHSVGRVPHIDRRTSSVTISNIPSSPAYGVFISQSIRYARASTKYTDFVLRARRLSDKLLSQGYVCDRLTSSLRTFYGRYGELVVHYDAPLSRMVDDILS